jgi:uncharacterized protein (DUF4213/DUF364 family)
MISEELIKETGADLEGKQIADLRIGLGYTVVRLDSGETGLAGTLRYDLPRGCSLLDRAGDFEGTRAKEAAELLTRPDPLLAAIGLATINAVLNRDQESNTDSPLEALSITAGDSVGMVGNFAPLMDPIKQRTEELYVFEREPSSGEEIYPDWAVNSLLPECDVAIISSTTLMNGTLEHLFELSPERTALLGPSTPMTELLEDYGVSHLFGSVVRKPEAIIEIVSQAGGTRNFGEAVEKINLEL